MDMKPELLVHYCRTYGGWCHKADEVGQCELSGCTRLNPYQVNVGPVMLWDDPVIVTADFARNNDMTAFAVAIGRDFKGEKTFKFFDNKKEYEVIVKSSDERGDE